MTISRQNDVLLLNNYNAALLNGDIYHAVNTILTAGWFGGGEEGDKGENGGDSKGVKESAGALFPSKKDPAISEEHGHLSGVRRNSKEEALSADSTRSKSTGSPPRLRRATSTYSSVDKR